MPAVLHTGWTERIPVRDCVGLYIYYTNINYVENLIRVIQRLMPPSVHLRADKIYNINFKWLNRLQKNVGYFFKTL